MKWQVNHYHFNPEICIGAKAQLSTEHLRLPLDLTQEFAPQFVGPSEVLATVTPISFCL